ncbi:MAG: hypothetical protein J7M19_01475 [Planctomycetes bacterium]|nr:hypothetical protein [Planctomycetota bacterium]
MLRRVVVLFVLVAMLGVFVGCTYNYSNVGPTAGVRRLAIAGENMRLVGEDIDWLLGIQDYPTSGRYHH